MVSVISSRQKVCVMVIVWIMFIKYLYSRLLVWMEELKVKVVVLKVDHVMYKVQTLSSKTEA